MQLAIVHYHLNRGGVTQAVLNHLHALATLPDGRQPHSVLVLHSGQRSGWPDRVWADDENPPFPVSLAEVPLLEYDTTGAVADADRLAGAMHDALGEAGFDPTDTLLHVHNHALGKNASLPGALRSLTERGYRLLLQAHDFAEDFRPANYRHLMRATRSGGPEGLAETLYPAGTAIHYAVLNARDNALLTAAGVAEPRLHLLPNPVLPFRKQPKHEEARQRVLPRLGLEPDTRLVVYPVRGIRRKNVGEMLLHSALANASAGAGGGSCYAVTLAPTNPVEVPPFVRWQELSEELGLNCRFDIGGPPESGGGVDFLDALAAADAMITTSVAEGFGMVFLEAWLAGRMLVGRDLPEITEDFSVSGLRLDGLSPKLLVPTAWFDAPAAERDFLELEQWTRRDFGLPPRLADLDNKPDCLGETVDFASLPARFQVEVIRRVADDPAESRDRLCELNPTLAEQLVARSDDYRGVIEANAQRVLAEYSPEAIGRRLSAAYQAVMAGDAAPAADALPAGRSILDYFLTPERLRPVRLET